MNKVARMPLVIACFVQDGCPHCESYLPIFRGVAERYQHCVPSMVVSADEHPGAADLYRVMETPTTIALRYGRRSMVASLSGVASPEDLERFYQAFASGCDLG